ncbi:LysE family translocator [Guptibacillus hwajinpoensis]|uniref:Threonine/homoserine/homoserine lactone efflux protein n=1 Tax=Guptibacillus hwajinpoensis TaxID=208199 RepID=A0ABU0K8V5_9BACL|nr:LysE family transporter [Alkalihalobacillus hemicentroti]MDQ0484931.1 threonine/homoserine/homoserine lactone efflux protein [Alkalihalobacillus hemicentroti]
MSIFFSYILLGLSLSAPMGPINAAQLDRGIRFGFMNAWLVGFGAMVADGIFMLMIYFGISHVIDTDFMRSFLWLFGCFVLMYTGIESIKNAGSVVEERNSEREANRKSFRTGFFMAISNPLNILFWLGIYGSILAKTSSAYGASQLFVYSLGIFIGITMWDLTMAGVATGARKWMSPKVLSGISILSGVILIGFGVYFGREAIRLLIG